MIFRSERVEIDYDGQNLKSANRILVFSRTEICGVFSVDFMKIMPNVPKHGKFFVIVVV